MPPGFNRMAVSKLQGELKKKRPFESLEQETALSILRTSDQLQIRFERLFRDYGLTSSQYNVLRILRGAGEPLPILEIASRTIAVVPGITGLIDRLEAAGFVERVRCAEDRRVIFVAITRKAVETLSRLDAPLIALHQNMVGCLSKDDQRTLIQLLERLRETLAKDQN